VIVRTRLIGPLFEELFIEASSRASLRNRSESSLFGSSCSGFDGLCELTRSNPSRALKVSSWLSWSIDDRRVGVAFISTLLRLDLKARMGGIRGVTGGFDSCGCAESVGDFSIAVVGGIEMGGGMVDCSATQSEVLSECLWVSIAGGGPFQESLSPFLLCDAGVLPFGFAKLGWDEAESSSVVELEFEKPGKVRGRANGRDGCAGEVVAVADSE
jgi:hypothetical protein